MQQPHDASGAKNVFDIFSGDPLSDCKKDRYIRLSPELDGLCLLYSNNRSPDKLFSMNILCWALRESGEIDALVPWLNDVMPAMELSDEECGNWEGYYDPANEFRFSDPPRHKALELETAAEYFGRARLEKTATVQEFADSLGTHALLIQPGCNEITLAEIMSWRLNSDGEIDAMLMDESQVGQTPVLPGDDCLYTAQSQPSFRYFFQHHAANQIKAHEPGALAAIAMLMGD
ncbi:MAG: hypothetical protein V7711_12425 [Pseudomonadales bacterium]